MTGGLTVEIPAGARAIFAVVRCASLHRVAGPIGPATRCDEMGHFAAILKVLEASQTIAAHRNCAL